jgi:outer membrane autotransporter protein
MPGNAKTTNQNNLVLKSIEARRPAKAPVLGAAVAGLMLLPHATPALANCSPYPSSSGDIVTCDGNPNGYKAIGLDELTVNIVPGTNFNGPFLISNSGILDITTAGNMNSVTLNNNDVIRFENLGNMNQGLVITGDGDYTVINRSGAFINTPFTMTGDSDNTILNEGTLNNGITVTGDGTTGIRNAENAFINNGIFINGASQTVVDNMGTIQSNTLLGSGDDAIVNHGNGTINGAIDEGAGDDQFLMKNGKVNADIQQNTGKDYFQLSGGEVTGFIRSGDDDDLMDWTSGGLLGGIDMGDGTDRANLYSLDSSQLRQIQIDGGQGADDKLFIFSAAIQDPQRLKRWELIGLTSGTTLTLNDNLVLGDSGTLTGKLAIDTTASVLAGDRHSTISAFDAGSDAVVENAGTIDLTNGSDSTADTLMIFGDYTGASGLLKLQSVLGTDGSPSDKLVIDGGTATGSTGIDIANVGGTGKRTKLDGILVVEAVNGATTDPKSFKLAQRVTAGAYEYLLFRGSTDGTNEFNYYLRNHIRDIDIPDIDPPYHPPPDIVDPDKPDGGDGDNDNDGDDDHVGGDYDIPLIRPEVPILSAVPAVTRGLLRTTIGTFHDRMGEQEWLTGADAGHVAWMRVFGKSYNLDMGGLLGSEFDGNFWGMQLGAPVYTTEHANGQEDTLGLFAGYSRGNGDIEGNLFGLVKLNVGDLGIDAYNIGGYWTHTWTNGSYVDAVVMQSWLNVNTSSIGGYSTKIDGSATTLSLEAGTPFAITDGWAIEPQAQIIWSGIDFDKAHDPGSSIRYNVGDGVTGRLGFRVTGTYDVDGKKVNPFLLANVWHSFEAKDTLKLENAAFSNKLDMTTLELGVGVSAQLNTQASVYAKASYDMNLGGNDFHAIEGNIGLNVKW